MIETYCDACDEELKTPEDNVVSARIKGAYNVKGRNIVVEIMAGTGKTLNFGYLCRRCLLELVRGLFPKQDA